MDSQPAVKLEQTKNLWPDGRRWVGPYCVEFTYGKWRVKYRYSSKWLSSHILESEALNAAAALHATYEGNGYTLRPEVAAKLKAKRAEERSRFDELTAKRKAARLARQNPVARNRH